MTSIRKAHGQRRVVFGALLMVALVAVVVAGLRTGLLALPFGHQSISPPHDLTCTGEDCALGQGVRAVQLFVEPRDGATPITNAILGATRSVWVEVYLLTDSRVMDALAGDAQRGVDVRVLLEAHPFGSDVASPQRTIDTLAQAGIQATFANPAYTYTHAKMLIVDNATLYVLTANLSRSGLGGSSLARNREFGVVDTHADDVAEALAIFQADWNRTRPALHDGNMVVSPFNARAMIMALLALARTSLVIEDEEMYDPAAETALIVAAHRGVRVRLVLPDPSMIAASDAARLKSGGVRVEYVSAPYIHAKVIVADGRLAFVGSENFSPTSLDQNREVGLLLADTSALATIAATFERATGWSASPHDSAVPVFQKERPAMTTEIARYHAQPGKADELARGLTQAMDVFKRAEGCRSIRLSRAVEDDQLFMYEIEWISVEYHIEVFRKGPLFTEYRSHITGLFVEPVDMMHFETIAH